MKITLQYGNEVLALPAAVLDVMSRADAADLRVLLCLCADAAMRSDAASLCARAGCSEAQLQASLAFWRGAGVLAVSEEDAISDAVSASPAEIPVALSKETEVEVASVPRTPESLPKYTTEELTALLERRREAATLIDECQRVLGRIFNMREISILVALLDYLALDVEYLILLCAHCASLGKTSMHYIEKVAMDMVDGGAVTVEALQETLRREDAARAVEGQIRALFGAQDRKLTQTERKYIRRWTEEWKFDLTMITLAYEATVDSIGSGSMRYTDGVLKRWQTEGLTTPEAVAASDERWRASHAGTPNADQAGRAGKNGKSGKGEHGGSFDTDDFFEAALRRSFDDLG